MGGWAGGRHPPPSIGANTALWANTKITKWQKIIKFKCSPYFWLGGLKNSSGKGVHLGCDMFQAERNSDFLLPFFLNFNVFPTPIPPLELPLGHHFTYGPQMKICWDHSIQPEDQ